jgi:Tfp pilus assembly protein PilO
MLGIPEWAIGVVVIILTIAGSVLIVHLIRPELSRRDPKSRVADPTEHGQTLEDVQVRLGELDQLKQRMSELEERVDFAERLLARQREGPRLGSPQGT